MRDPQGARQDESLQRFLFTRIMGHFFLCKKEAFKAAALTENLAPLIFSVILIMWKIMFFKMDEFLMGRFLIQIHEKRCVGSIESEQRGGQPASQPASWTDTF